jgi:hypothetical protein
MTDTVHLITPEYAPSRGGVASHTRQLAAGLAASGVSVHVWAPAGAEPAGAEGVHVHPELGRFSRRDLARVATLLDNFVRPRRLIVQWVPQGFGYRGLNVGFCAWVWKMARRGEMVEIFVHEPHLALEGGSWRQTAAALVQRVMSIMLLRAARRVWIAIPAWEQRWRPYTLGRSVPFVWLPIPSALPRPDAEDVAVIRQRMNASRVLGHLGTYGRPIAPLLRQVLAESLARMRDVRVLLIGEGSERFQQEFAAACPEYAARVSATGVLSDAAVRRRTWQRAMCWCSRTPTESAPGGRPRWRVCLWAFPS